jgi:hypothetical protein
MEFKQEIISVNLNKVKYLMMEKLVVIFVENGGVIFGGWIRDKIVHDHFAAKFHKAKMNMDKYSDPEYHPETKLRLLVANDIDVFIRGNKDDVRRLFDDLETKGYKVVEKDVKQKYLANANLDHRKIEIVIKGMNAMGIRMRISVDILFSEEENIEPPFGNLDLLCNGLIMDKSGIRLSTQTGDWMDKWSHPARKREELEILEKMTKLRSDIARVNDDESENRKILRIDRIIRMQERGWKVNNGIFYPAEKCHNSDVKTCISCSGDTTSEYVVKFKCCGVHIHHICLCRLMRDPTPQCPKCEYKLEF